MPKVGEARAADATLVCPVCKIGVAIVPGNVPEARCHRCGYTPPPSVVKAAKVAYVRRETQTRNHECHWPGCGKQVKPAYWGCGKHWMMLPARLRNAIWAAYRPGQEKTMTPSRDYVRVARETQDWIRENYPNG